MFSTQYSLAQSFANIGSGRNDRILYADIASKFHSLSEQVGYLSVKARNAFGDGANASNRHDDTNAILDAITEATLSGRGIEFPAGVYYITKNVTIFDCKFYKGAILLPANNTVTITIVGTINAGSYRIFDYSLGGKVLITSKIPTFDAFWFGVVGDKIANDTPNLDNLLSSVPDYCRVMFSPGTKMRLNSTFSVQVRNGIEFYTPGRPQNIQASANCAMLSWNGPLDGTMLKLYRTQFVLFKGFFIELNNCGVGIDIDQPTPGPQIQTQPFIEWCYFYQNQQKAIRHIQISNIARSNVEYCFAQHCTFNGGGESLVTTGGFVEHPNWTINTTTGSVNVTINAPNWSSVTAYINNDVVIRSNIVYQCITPHTNQDPPLDVSHNFWITLPTINIGDRIRIAGAGGLVNGKRSGFDDVVATITDQKTFALTNPVTNGVAGAYWVHRQCYGTAIWNAASANAKRHITRNNTYQWCFIGLDIAGGGLFSFEDNFSGCDTAYAVGGAMSGVCIMQGTDAENCRVILKNTSALPVYIKGSRFAPNWIDPILGFIQPTDTGDILSLEDITIDAYSLPANTRLFDVRNAKGKLYTKHCAFGNLNTTTLGLNEFDPTLSFSHIAINNAQGSGTARDIFRIDGGNEIIGTNAGIVTLGGRVIVALPGSIPDDATLPFKGPFSGLTGFGSCTYRLNGTAILERRLVRPDGTFATAQLPVDTSATATVTSVGFTVRNALELDYGREVPCDATGGDVQYQFVDALLPVGWWAIVRREDDGSAGHNVIIGPTNPATGTVNGITGAGAQINVIGKYTTYYVYKRAAGTFIVRPFCVMPINDSWTVPAIANGAQASHSATIKGAVPGYSIKSCSNINRQGLNLWSDITANDTVVSYISNNTGGAITLGALNLEHRIDGSSIV